jgi:alpha-galactosidase
VINFSNPMSRVCLAILRKFERRVKVVGLCHEIGNAEVYLPDMLGTPWSNLQVKAAGLNHFGVLLEVKYRDSGRDAYPDIRAKAPSYFDQVLVSDDLMYGIDKSLSLIKDILRVYNYLPYTHDSHFGEYIQWAWERSDQEHVREFYEFYKIYCQGEQKRLEDMVAEKRSARNWLYPTEERVVPIIEGVLTDSGQHELSVNIPNDGIIENLPQDIVVECPATVDKDGVHGVKVGKMPSGLAALMRTQATVQELTVEAALTGSRQKALEALLADPEVDSLSSAEKMLDEIIQLQGVYLNLK